MSGRFTILDQVDALLEEEDGHYITEVLDRGMPDPPEPLTCSWCQHPEHGLTCAPLLDYAPSSREMLSYYKHEENGTAWHSCKCPSSFGDEPDPSLFSPVLAFDEAVTFSELARSELVASGTMIWPDWPEQIGVFTEQAQRAAQAFREMTVQFTITADQMRGLRPILFGQDWDRGLCATAPRQFSEPLQAALDAQRGRNTGPARASAQTAHRPRTHR